MPPTLDVLGVCREYLDNVFPYSLLATNKLNFHELERDTFQS